MNRAAEYQKSLRMRIEILSIEYDDLIQQYRRKSEIEHYTYLTLDTTRDDYVSPVVYKERADVLKEEIDALKEKLRDPSLVEVMGDLIDLLPPTFMVNYATRGRTVPIEWLNGGDSCEIIEPPFLNRRYHMKFKRYVLNGESVLLDHNDDLDIVYRVVAS